MEGNINFSGNLSGSIDAGGGSGTSNYNDLENKPKINNVTLSGNKTNQQLGIPTGTYNELTGKPSINNVELTGNRTTADLGLFSGNYNDLTNKPTIFDGDYTDLDEKPTINNVELIGNRTTEDLGLFSGAYADLTGKPALKTVATTGSYNDLTDKPTIPAAQVNADWDAASGVAQILHKPTLATVATSGSYDDLTDKPTIPAAQVNSDWNAASGVAQILNKPTLATVATSGSYDDLTDKPTIPDSAVEISYDNTTSGMAATDVQDAIDENAADIVSLYNSLTQKDIDISSAFTLSSSGGLQGMIQAFYNSNTKRVHGTISAYSDGTIFSTTTPYATVNSTYRPSSTVTFTCIVWASSSLISPYYGTIETNGNILQKLTSTSTRIYGVFEYYLPCSNNTFTALN